MISLLLKLELKLSFVNILWPVFILINLKLFLSESGFTNLPAAKDGDKAGFICDTFFYSRFSSHRVCRPEFENNHPTIVSIDAEIKNLLTYYNDRIFFSPSKIYVETKNVYASDVKGNIITKTSRSILQDFDPSGLYMNQNNYLMSATISQYTNLVVFNNYMDAFYKQNTYTDGYTYFRFVVYFDDLSVLNDHSSPYFPTYTSSYNTDYRYDNNNNSGFLIVLLFGFLVILFSVCIIFIIRRKLKQQNNQDSETSVEEQQQVVPQMTSYPIFVQSNPQMTNPYPIFVSTNPQMNLPQQTNVPFAFPQPQVFYPMQTNQNQ